MPASPYRPELKPFHDVSAFTDVRDNDTVLGRADLTHFYVITPISNQWRFKRRYELYWKFARMCEQAGVKLITVEQAFGNREFVIAQPDNPYHVQVRSHDEVWLKENMINLGVTRALQLDPLAREVAWVDADCFPMIPAREWFEETWHALQHYEFVQMWRDLLNFGPKNELIGVPQPSFMYTYEQNGFTCSKNDWIGMPKLGSSDYDYTHHIPGTFTGMGRPGLAWAANVSAFNAVGGLIDGCVLGSGDWHMSFGLCNGMTEQTTLVGTLQGHGSQEYKFPAYTDYLLQWQAKCNRWIKQDVGYVPVTVGHWWHGKYKNRRYGNRGLIMTENEYNPYTDIKKDGYGVIQLETWEPRQIRLRDLCRDYFRTREEDSIDQ